VGVEEPPDGLLLRGDENVRSGPGRVVVRSREDEELLLDEEEMTEAFRLRAARTAAEPGAGKLGELNEGGEGVSTSAWSIVGKRIQAYT
jgi:hypothetical protein